MNAAVHVHHRLAARVRGHTLLWKPKQSAHVYKMSLSQEESLAASQEVSEARRRRRGSTRRRRMTQSRTSQSTEREEGERETETTAGQSEGGGERPSADQPRTGSTASRSSSAR